MEPTLVDALAVRSVTGRAESAECRRSLLRVAGRLRCIRWSVTPCKICGLPPALPHALDDGIDLLVGQHAACALRESRHRRAGPALGDRVSQRFVVDDGEINRIADGRSRTVLAISAMTSGAVLLVEHNGIENVGGPRHHICGCVAFRGRLHPASAIRHTSNSAHTTSASSSSLVLAVALVHQAGRFNARTQRQRQVFLRSEPCFVGPRPRPATIPNATCEAANHHQLIRSSRAD